MFISNATIILSIIFVLVGVITSPTSTGNDAGLGGTTQETQSDSENKTSNSGGSTSGRDSSTASTSIEKDTQASTKPNASSSSEEKVIMVWVTSTGTKYHSNSICSKMNSPSQISREEAISRGYGPCSKCY